MAKGSMTGGQQLRQESVEGAGRRMALRLSLYAGDDQTQLARTGEYKFNSLALRKSRRWLRPWPPPELVGGISMPTWNSIAPMQTQLRMKPETVLSSSLILSLELTGRRKGK